MENSKHVEILNRVLHGTVNSVVQYIGIAEPYVPEGCEEHFQTILRMREEETATAHAITNLLAAMGGTPKVGVFDFWNVDLNYLDLRWMARFAAGHHEKLVAEIEAELELVRDEPRVHGLLAGILEEKRTHLAQLNEIGREPAKADG